MNDRLYRPLPPRPERYRSKSARILQATYMGLADWISILLRSLSIHILNFPRLRQTSEPPKAAIQKSRIKALLRSSIHIAPLSASIFLIQLNWRKQYYVRESPYISALPYVAKFHEILMQMSIAAIAATWIRKGLLQESGMQFGAVVAIAQTSNPAYLWSPEFWGAMTAVWSRPSKAWRPLLFGLAVILAIALGSTVGPSSTVAMLPRDGKFYYTGALHTFDQPESECFPTEILAQPVNNICTQLYNSTSERNIDNFHCSPNDAEAAIAMRYIIEKNRAMDGEMTTELGGALALRQFKTWIKTPSNYDSYSESGYFAQDRRVPSPFNATITKSWGGRVVGTTQQLNIASALDGKAQAVVDTSFGWSEKNQGGIPLTYSVDTKAPYVSAQCFSTEFYNETRTHSAKGSNNGSILTPWEFSSTDRVQFPTFQDTIFDHIDLTMEEFQRISLSSNRSQITWIDPPPQYRLNISILALVQTPRLGIVCAVKAAWGPTTMNSTSGVEARRKSVRRDSVQASSIPETWRNSTTWPAEIVSISPDFMNLVLPPRDANNETSQEVSDLIEGTVVGLASLPEILVIGVTAGGMSRLAHSIREVYSYAWTQTEPALPGSYNIVINPYYAGNGWLIQDLTDRLAMAILLVYCIVAALHICYHFITGISSNSWDSISEMIALALNSRSPESLRNASAGISTIKTFAQPVGIRVRNYSGLEMVFLRDESGVDDIGKVVVDQKY